MCTATNFAPSIQFSVFGEHHVRRNSRLCAAVARSGHVAFVVDEGQKMLVAGSYAEDSDELTVALLTFATMRWTIARVDPRGQTPSRRAAISGGLLPAMGGGARLPPLGYFWWF